MIVLFLQITIAFRVTRCIIGTHFCSSSVSFVGCFIYSSLRSMRHCKWLRSRMRSCTPSSGAKRDIKSMSSFLVAKRRIRSGCGITTMFHCARLALLYPEESCRISYGNTIDVLCIDVIEHRLGPDANVGAP